MKLRVLELFGGIGACTKALKKINIEYEIVDYVEIDKFAVKSYNALNNTNFKPQDVRNYDKDIEVDLIMHGSPCQDFSFVGEQKGAKEGGNTSNYICDEVCEDYDLSKCKDLLKLNIRYLTPKECWRLMGFDDEDFNKVEKINSNTQLYKQAGNSIVVNVLELILINLLFNDKPIQKQTTIFDFID